MAFIKSNQWGYEIKVKQFFENAEVTAQATSIGCRRVVTELRRIQHEVSHSQIVEEQREHIKETLGEIIDHFEFCQSLASGTIEEKEWNNYSFDGDFESMFNGYLGELYDLANERIIVRSQAHDMEMKFLWVG